MQASQNEKASASSCLNAATAMFSACKWPT